MSYRKPHLNSWVPADGYEYRVPADGARYRGNVARDQHGTCLVPRSRWAEVAAIIGIEPPDGLDSASDVTVDMALDAITDHVTASAQEEALDPIYEQADADDSQL
eukprot:4486354-Pyramimonas_sp.AAC.1